MNVKNVNVKECEKLLDFSFSSEIKKRPKSDQVSKFLTFLYGDTEPSLIATRDCTLGFILCSVRRFFRLGLEKMDRETIGKGIPFHSPSSIECVFLKKG